MPYLSIILQSYVVTAIIYICIFPTTQAETAELPYDYQLSISFDLDSSQLTGTTKISLKPNQTLSLSLRNLKVTGALLKDQNGGEKLLSMTSEMVMIPASSDKRELFISYTRTVANSFENIISRRGISLVSNWYPVPDVDMKFRLSASLPEGFTAVSETDIFPLQRDGNISIASFSQPVQALHFTAGPYVHQKLKVRDGLFVYSLFFAEDQKLAGDYLRAAAKFLLRYEKEIGPYPYNHYVIAANRLPTGFAIPGYTLIGQQVLRLPFIKETSLGHEILHSWFGNSVTVDYREGNWCEALTSYLADYSYRAEKGEAIEHRKSAITSYLNNVSSTNPIPLSEFKSASHNQPQAKAIRAVGYTRGAMLFHELKEKIGAQSFAEAIKLFYLNNKGNDASWADLQKSFETYSTIELDDFFKERLQRREIPELEIKEVEVSYKNNKPVLSFTIHQLPERPFSLLIPIQVRSVSGTTMHTRLIKDDETRISIELADRPLEFAIDPDYTFLRRLSQAETAAVWSGFMGAEKRLVILASEKERDIFSSLLETLKKENLVVKISKDVTNQELGENNLLFMGTDQGRVLSLFSNPNHSKKGFTLDVRTNPLDPKYTVVLVSSENSAETKAVSRRLSHYGKYSYLRFVAGRNLEKKITQTPSGIRVVLETLPDGGKTAPASSFDEIIDDLSKSRVIYVGETHTSLADHRLQLRIIEALYARDPNLAIGMEMFPASKQDALDRYISADENMDERTFLQESEYFKVWSYDYRFFRDIINFAKNNSIPLIGINLEKDIVSKVFRTGNTDGLDKAVLGSLPKERNLDMEGYRQRLSAIHNLHSQATDAMGKISGFLQAQALWDETMAENIANYLEKYPQRRMVVLAGNQHSRKDSGIPPRVKRRIDIKQSSVLNINTENGPANLKQVADYYFLSDAQVLPETPKLGIVLETVKQNGAEFLKIKLISPHGKAGKAGLQEEDIFKQIDGLAIKSMNDLRIAMLDTKIGESISVKVLRTEDGQERELEFNVELSSSVPVPKHP